MYEISKFNPHYELLEFRAKHTDFKQMWKECPRGDWMLWLAKSLGVDLNTLTLAKVKCAETVKYLMRDERSINALYVALKFSQGEVTSYELLFAAAAAHTAYDETADYAYDETADAAAYAAYAAAYAAYAADTADYAAEVAVNTAFAVAFAVTVTENWTTNSAAFDAAKKQNQLETANICREILTDAVFKLI